MAMTQAFAAVFATVFLATVPFLDAAMSAA